MESSSSSVERQTADIVTERSSACHLQDDVVQHPPPTPVAAIFSGFQNLATGSLDPSPAGPEFPSSASVFFTSSQSRKGTEKLEWTSTGCCP